MNDFFPFKDNPNQFRLVRELDPMHPIQYFFAFFCVVAVDVPLYPEYLED
jgi:hypothetical protein